MSDSILCINNFFKNQKFVFKDFTIYWDFKYSLFENAMVEYQKNIAKRYLIVPEMAWEGFLDEILIELRLKILCKLLGKTWGRTRR